MLWFDAPWSRFLKVVSAGITLLITGAFWLTIPISSIDESLQFKAFIIVLPILLLGASAIFIIRGYEIKDDQLEIVRIIGRKTYPISTFERAEPDPEATNLSIRMMGNGGLYSFSGYFRNQKIGRYRAFVTNKANCVVLYRKNGIPIVVSPESPHEFAEAIKQLV